MSLPDTPPPPGSAPADTELTLRARFAQPASPRSSPLQPLLLPARQPRSAPAPAARLGTLPLPLPGRPGSAGAAGGDKQPPASPDPKAALLGCFPRRLPLRPGAGTLPGLH